MPIKGGALLFCLLKTFLGSQNTKESDSESMAEEDGTGSEVSSSSQIKQNGVNKKTKHTAKTRTNGDYFFIFTLFHVFIISFMTYFFPPTDTLSQVNGHSGKNTFESNSEQEETAKEEEDQIPLSHKPSRSTAGRSRITSEEEAEESDERQTTRNKAPVSSDEEYCAKKRPQQNGRTDKESFHRDSKKKSKVSASKSQDKQKSASTKILDGGESDELSDPPPKRSSPQKKGTKKVERSPSSNGSDLEIRKLTRSKTKRPHSTSASESSEEYKPQRKSWRKHSTGSSDQESDHSDDASKRRLNLRALPKKKYIVDNSLSEDDVTRENQRGQKTSNKRELESKEEGYNTRVSRRTSPSEGRNQVTSKRKRIYTSDSEDEEEDAQKEPLNISNSNSRSGSSKSFKRESKQDDKESDTSSHSDSREEEEEEDIQSNRRRKSLRQPKPKRKKSYSSSKHSSDSESKQMFSASENSFSSSGSHSSPKRRSRTRTERPTSCKLRLRRHQRILEEDSEPQRMRRVNTRNRGKRTVSYRDSEWKRGWRLHWEDGHLLDRLGTLDGQVMVVALESSTIKCCESVSFRDIIYIFYEKTCL